MSLVNVLNVIVIEPEAEFSKSLKFEIFFECLNNIDEGIFIIFNLDIEWKLTYVGSANDKKYDQLLETIEIGPLQTGAMKFIFEVIITFDYQHIFNIFLSQTPLQLLKFQKTIYLE